MPGTNLTRDEAATRAALLDVTSYTIDLDLTTSDTTFGSTTTIRFTLHASPGADDLRRPASARPSTRSRSTASAVDPATAYADSRIALTGLAADNELVVARRLHLLAHAARACTASSTRPTTGSTSTRSSRSRTPAASTPPSSSPTSRRRTRSHVTAPDALEGRLQRADPRAARTLGDGTARLAVPGDQADVDLHHRAGRRRVPRGASTPTQGKHGEIPLGPLLPPVAGRAPRRRRAGRSSPSRASSSSRRPSTTPTRSASTTSSTCRSTTWARWRTPAA